MPGTRSVSVKNALEEEQRKRLKKPKPYATARIVLSVLTILLIISCSTVPRWEWKANFYVADHNTQDIMSADGKVISCSDPAFDDFACLSYDNIAELEAEIEKFRDKYDGLIGFVKLAIKDSIKKRKGQDTEDLAILLEILDVKKDAAR